MLVRLVQIFIVMFWAVMTAMLCRLVFFPEETRLSQISPQLAVERFLARRAPSDLLILDGNREIGDVTISPSRLSQAEREKGIDLGRPAEHAELEMFLAGKIKIPSLVSGGGSGGGFLRYSSRVWLDDEFRPVFLQFEGRFPDVPEPVGIEIDPLRQRYRLKRGNLVLVDTAEGTSAHQLNAQASLLLAAWGIEMPEGIGAPVSSPEAHPPVAVVAREGMVTVGGHRFSAYLLDLPLPWGGKLRFVLTKAGELLRVDGFLAYQIVAQDFAPPLRDAD